MRHKCPNCGFRGTIVEIHDHLRYTENWPTWKINAAIATLRMAEAQASVDVVHIGALEMRVSTWVKDLAEDPERARVMACVPAAEAAIKEMAATILNQDNLTDRLEAACLNLKFAPVFTSGQLAEFCRALRELPRESITQEQYDARKKFRKMLADLRLPSDD